MDTYYNLEITRNEIELPIEFAKPIIKEIRETGDTAQFAIDENGDRTNFLDWDFIEEELTEISRKYPELLFTVYMQDEYDEYSVLYVMNGGHQYGTAEVEVTYEPFDPEALEYPA